MIHSQKCAKIHANRIHLQFFYSNQIKPITSILYFYSSWARHRIFFSGFFTTPINNDPLKWGNSIVVKDTKWLSAKAMQLELIHGKATSSNAFEPCSMSSFTFPSPIYPFSNINRIITPLSPQAEFCISNPFSSLNSIATQRGNPYFIQQPSCQCHLIMFSSTKILLPTLKFTATWLLTCWAK